MIFHFSATSNSRFVALRVAEALGEKVARTVAKEEPQIAKIISHIDWANLHFDDVVTKQVLQAIGNVFCLWMARNQFRGAMTRFIIENRNTNPDDLSAFCYEGFEYNPTQESRIIRTSSNSKELRECLDRADMVGCAAACHIGVQGQKVARNAPLCLNIYQNVGMIAV